MGPPLPIPVSLSPFSVSSQWRLWCVYISCGLDVLFFKSLRRYFIKRNHTKKENVDISISAGHNSVSGRQKKTWLRPWTIRCDAYSWAPRKFTQLLSASRGGKKLSSRGGKVHSRAVPIRIALCGCQHVTSSAVLCWFFDVFDSFLKSVRGCSERTSESWGGTINPKNYRSSFLGHSEVQITNVRSSTGNRTRIFPTAVRELCL